MSSLSTCFKMQVSDKHCPNHWKPPPSKLDSMAVTALCNLTRMTFCLGYRKHLSGQLPKRQRWVTF